MKNLDILPVRIFSFELCQDLLNDTLTKIKSIEWYKNYTNSISNESLNSNPDFENLHLFLDNCLQEVNSYLKLPFEKMVLTQSWANKSLKNQEHHSHTHSNSFMSGIIYLTTHKSGQTYFETKNIWKTNLFFKSSRQGHRIVPEAGKVLIFPSELRHGVLKLEEDEERYTISFNAFPSGNIGKFAEGVNIETKQFTNYLVKK